MLIVADRPDLKRALASREAVALVPTMGNLHDGHLRLVELARRRGACVVVSIFVNPLQFGPSEDLATYPRTLAEDCAKLERAGAEVVFAPSEAVLYPRPQSVFVEPPPIAGDLCGAVRPGHFRGVATVVLKLLHMVGPRFAVFGKKDYQQLFIVRTMVEQLDVPVEIVAGETVRAADGLALSSRNGYLGPEERRRAPRLYRVLRECAQALAAGGRCADVEQAGRAQLESDGWRVDYVAVRSQATLLPPARDDTALVVLGAAWLGRTRLIDNVEVLIGEDSRL
ncbi:MAG: pantoate--beta-alanine ligase [Betaproteobacteria bacterium]|nr:pantoate--beta-alanine ligase [Betaproteobacteria bacterium]